MKYNDKVLYNIIKPIDYIIIKLLFKPTIEGLENIPDSNVIFAGNHTKWLDPVILLGVIPKQVHFLAKIELFNGILGLFMNAMGCIAVNRKVKDKSVLDTSYKYLENNCSILLFPEGTINRTDDIIMPFKIGAVKMSNVTNTPIIPFVITGKYRLFRKSIRIKFLKPMYTSNNLDESNKKLMNVIKDEIERKNNEKKK